MAPLSLIVSAFAPVSDVRRTLSPAMSGADDSVYLLVDLGGGKCRLGASALAQVYGSMGSEPPDLDHPELLKSFFGFIQALNRAGLLLAYHDRSDGGLFVTLCEMMFASRVGITISGELGLDGGDRERNLAVLFNEELGAVIHVRRADVETVRAAAEDAGLRAHLRDIGTPNDDDRLRIVAAGTEIYSTSRIELQRAWSETTYHMQRLRDHPECAEQEYDRILDASDPGLHAHLTFDPAEDISLTFLSTRPRIAILREQGVNGQMEMAAAFDHAGFSAVDVHMSDIIAGRVTLKDFAGFAACGGFSYGDVLGAGEGWAKSILFNARAREEFESFFQRADTFALGVCNGCQMMSNLRELIPGAECWPHFVRNKSEQFEARVAMLEVLPSPSIFLAGMAGSRIPIAVAHGEGYAELRDARSLESAKALIALRYIDNHGRPTEWYPYNPNGSPGGITGLTTPDGRHTILMPHPERVFRTVGNSWHPPEWGEDGPWMRIFRNARKWLG
jgi:phosphoribosylformylglycinamidine synthase